MLRWAATAAARIRRGVFISGALLVDEQLTTFRREDAEAFVDALLLVKGRVYFHDATRVLLWLFDRLYERGLHLEPGFDARTIDRGRLLLAIHTGATRLEDSRRLWPVDLRGFTEGLETVEGRGPAREAHQQWAGLLRLRDHQVALGLDGRGSQSGTAWWTIWRRWRIPDADKSRARHAWCARAAFGGRIEVFRPFAEACNEFDQSMAYTAALWRLHLPVGEGNQLLDRGAEKALHQVRAGLYHAQVNSPEAHVPVLPFRTPTGRLGYPVGTFEGVWSYPELDYARSKGYEVRRVYRAQVYRRTDRLLAQWAEWVWRKRVEYEQSKSGEARPIADYLKGLANSLIGGFGLKPFRERLVFGPARSEVHPCPCRGVGNSSCACRGRCCAGCEGACGALSRLVPEKDVWVRRTFQLLPRSHAVWFAYVLGSCRVELHQAATVDGGLDLVTLKTDGILALGLRPVATRPTLGGWRLEHELVDVRALSGNIWTGTDARTGEVITRAAGIPRRGPAGQLYTDAQQARRIDPNRMLREAYPVWKDAGFSQHLRGAEGRVELLQLPEHLDDQGRRWYGSRILEPGAEYTRAPTVDELLQAG